MQMERRIKRDYRAYRKSPTKFMSINRKVRRSLPDNENYPDSAWGANLAVRQEYFEKSDQLEITSHQASNGDRILIRDRDRLIDEIIALLDEIALLLETMSRRNPDALYTTGFSVTQERRSTNRSRRP